MRLLADGGESLSPTCRQLSSKVCCTTRQCPTKALFVPSYGGAVFLALNHSCLHWCNFLVSPPISPPCCNLQGSPRLSVTGVLQMARGRRSSTPVRSKTAKNYKHPEAESPMRPEIGTQAQFKKKLPPRKYRYDDSLSPALEWDGQNATARERGEARIAKAEAELSEARKKLNGKPETKEAAGHIA